MERLKIQFNKKRKKKQKEETFEKEIYTRTHTQNMFILYILYTHSDIFIFEITLVSWYLSSRKQFFEKDEEEEEED